MHHSTMENFLRTAKTLGLGGVPALGLKKLVSIEASPTSSQEDLVPAQGSLLFSKFEFSINPDLRDLSFS